MRLSLASLLVVLALLLAPPAHAQSADPAAAAGPRAWAPMTTQPAAAVQPERRRPDEVLALGGVVGGGAGLVVGALAGAWLERPAYEDCLGICIGWGTVIGGLAGEALGLALGVHLANGRRGSLPLGMLTSAGILTVGAIGGNNIPPMLLIVPVTQIIATVTVERRTERRR
jgi:peptidoglycan/LPS O-acetylase OafA/YrhL